MNPTLHLPPQPIVTRWGTWLSACEYYADNFNAVRTVIENLDANDAVSARESKKLFASVDIRQQLAFIKANFMCIVNGINVLESKGLELKVSADIIENVKSTLRSIDSQEFLAKFERILDRNVGYNSLMQIKSLVYDGELENPNEYVDSLPPSLIALFKFAVVTSTDVERTFSIYKTILTERRQSFVFEHLKQHIILACNNELFGSF